MKKFFLQAFLVLMAVAMLGLYELVKFLGWLAITVGSWVWQQIWYIVAVIGALAACVLFGIWRDGLRTRKALPHLRAFVAIAMAEGALATPEEIPHADIQALQTILVHKGVQLPLPRIQHEVWLELKRHREVLELERTRQREALERERELQLAAIEEARASEEERRRAQELKRASHTVQAAVVAYLDADKWPSSVEIPPDLVGNVRTVLLQNGVDVDLLDVREILQLELNRSVDQKVEQALLARASERLRSTPSAWIHAYIDTFDENDLFVPSLARLIKASGHSITEADVYREVDELRKSRAHIHRVEVLSRAMERQQGRSDT